MRLLAAAFLVLLSSAVLTVSGQERQNAATGDVYRYEDAEGNLHLVDRIEKVPEAYRNSLDRVPRNPEITELGNSITHWLQNSETVAVLNRLYVRWVYVTIPAGVALLVLLLSFILPFLAKSGVARGSILVGGLFVFLVMHAAWVAPFIQERTRVFSRSLTAAAPRALDSGGWIRYEARTLQITRRPVPLNPFAFHSDILSLIPLHRDLFQP